MNYQEIIESFEEIMDSLNKMEINTQELIESKQSVEKLKKPTLNKTIQQLDQNIVATIQNQLKIIDSQFQLIQLVRRQVSSSNEINFLSRMEHDFQTKQTKFQTMLKSLH